MNDRPGRVARAATVAVMCGAMALSYAGIAAAVEPAAGALKPVYPLVVDGAALVALHEILRGRSRRRAARSWAWVTLAVAGATSVGLNTWHALSSGGLPIPVAVAYGTVPVLLAYLSSHLVTTQAKAVEDSASPGRRPARRAAPASAPAGPPDSQPAPVPHKRADKPAVDPAAAAAELAAEGKPISRNALRKKGIKGSNDRLTQLAEELRAQPESQLQTA